MRHFGIFLLLATGCTAGLDHDLPLQEALEGLVGRWTRADAGGIAVVVDRGGETIARVNLGKADREAGTPFTTRTPSYVASLTKPITALVVLGLHVDGTLSLDAPLADHLPDLPAPLGAVTARQILTHASGVPDWIGLAGGRTQCLDEIAGTTDDDVVALLTAHGGLDFPPDTDARYSNGGYVLLSRLAQAASEQSMPALVQARIAAPLGLETTWVIHQETPDPLPRAIGTKRSGALCDYALWTTGAGGIVASVDDLVVISRAVADGDLLPDDLRDEALAPLGPPLSPSASGHGLGWFVGDRAQGEVAWHTGNFGGFANTWLIAPEADLTIAALSNGSTRQVNDLAELILAHPDLR